MNIEQNFYQDKESEKLGEHQQLNYTNYPDFTTLTFSPLTFSIVLVASCVYLLICVYLSTKKLNKQLECQRLINEEQAKVLIAYSELGKEKKDPDKREELLNLITKAFEEGKENDYYASALIQIKKYELLGELLGRNTEAETEMRQISNKRFNSSSFLHKNNYKGLNFESFNKEWNNQIINKAEKE